MSLDSSPFRRAARPSHVLIAIASLACATVAFAAAPKTTETAKTAKTAVVKPAQSATGPMAMGGMPTWNAPEHYSVDMVVNHEGKEMTMKRFIDGPRIRTEIEAEGQSMTMIELGDAEGTSLIVMPSQKKVMKRSNAGMEEMMKMAPISKKDEVDEPVQNDAKIELVGKEKMNGRECEKYRCTFGDESGYAWVDAAEHFPVRMEFGKAQMDWKNYSVAPQPAALFEAPKGYEVIDMDEMMKKMGAMKGQPGMASLMGGMGGMGGAGVGGMANNMAGNFGGQMGSQMGTQFGTTLGASLGGPLGAMAGGYLGGKIGGMIGNKVARAVTPGN